MTTYLIRRILVMIPTIFGLTIVSFCLMQLAPGDPLQNSIGTQGAAGSEGLGNRESYLVQKRDLKLDLPLLLNLRYFYDYRRALRNAAIIRSLNHEQLAARLGEDLSPELLSFCKSLRIKEFKASLADSRRHARLASEIRGYTQIYCENAGKFSVKAAMELLDNPEISREQKIGLIQCLNFMVVVKHKFSYSKKPSAKETALILIVWQTWWDRNRDKLSPLPAAREQKVSEQFDEMSSKTRKELFELLGEKYFYSRKDMPFFAKKLLAEDTNLAEKNVAAAILKNYVSRPLEMFAPSSVSDTGLKEIIENWHVHYDPRKKNYQRSFLGKTATLFFDTQYAHVVRRLVTFQFGRTATPSKEPVGPLLWKKVMVSAPLMLMAQIVIYVVAVALGVICAINRGNLMDRGISLGLFVLYSIPPFVAGMLFLLFLCYNRQWFPMERLHSSDADTFGFIQYTLDYLWHAFLPVVCLSLFSLAAVAMYSRTSMLDVIDQDYIRTARAKGLSNSQVYFKHAFRNSLIPVLTLFSNILPAMLGGSVLIEVLFNIPGMGRLGFERIFLKDFPTLMALLYIDAIVVMLSILLTDILYVVVDPRISFGSQEGS